jgi:ATP-dependent DNA helicase DinG
MQSASEQEIQGVGTSDLRRIVEWSTLTQSGDLSEVLHTDDNTPLFATVSSTRDNCLGARCLQSEQCHVNLARKRAMAADVVVVNHHLFFADLNVRESGIAELLPDVRTVVFDEAHQINAIGVQFLGVQLTTHQLLSMCRDAAKSELLLGLGLLDGTTWLTRLEQATHALLHVVGECSPLNHLAWTGIAPEGLAEKTWLDAMQTLEEALADCLIATAQAAPMSSDLTQLHQRVQALHALLTHFIGPAQPGWVRWIEVSNQLRFFQSPIDIAQDMQLRVFNKFQTKSGQQKSWIFTSATLGHDPQLSWFVDSCGAQDSKVLRLDSPFDHAAQAAIYIPDDFPKPSDASHSAHVAALVADAAAVLGGRTMVLTTTLRAMYAIGSALSKHFSGFDEIEVLVQGDLPKQELLRRFFSVDGTTRGRILIGAATFWEGVDLPGDALQLLVIDKLPFVPPGDLLLDARVRRTVRKGRSAFNHVHLPLVAIALKQGAGRLIRRESDRGILVVCDVRMRNMAYGRRLLAALPPMRQLTGQEAFIAELYALTKFSTKGQSPP